MLKKKKKKIKLVYILFQNFICSSCCINVWKEGFESFDDQNLFLYRFDWTIFVRSCPPTPSSLPSSSSRRSPASSPTNSRDISSRSHTFPDFCLRLDSEYFSFHLIIMKESMPSMPCFYVSISCCFRE